MIWTTPDRTPEIDTLVQVLCRVLGPSEPQDGFYRSENMPVSSGDDGEGDMFVSIGFLAEFGGEPEWSVAGWDMTMVQEYTGPAEPETPNREDVPF